MFNILRDARDKCLEKYSHSTNIKDKNDYFNEYKGKLKLFMDEREVIFIHELNFSYIY
jgi:hypothetical protein